MEQKINIQINFFGIFIEGKNIPKILDINYSDTKIDLDRVILGHFFDLPATALSEPILKRYAEATTKELHTPITPHTEEIFKRLLEPLKSAKKNYCLGDYPATIASCGVVGEMLAMLIWKMNEVKIKNRPLAEKDEEDIFGRSFENLGQERRLKILKVFNFISDKQYKELFEIKEKRKPYLHFWTTDFKNEQADALTVLKNSFRLFKEITGIGLADAGKIKINPSLIKLFK